MKTIKLTILALALAQAAFSQIELPQVSGVAEVEQTIGYTKIEVDYARPNLNNRTAFGGELVPYGRIWRTGANNNTTIDINHDVTIEGQSLSKGKYALFTIPNERSWEIIFYKKTDNWGTPSELDDQQVALKLTVPVNIVQHKFETFTIGFNNARIDHATMFLAWENTQVEMIIKTNTFQQAEEVLKKQLNEKASARDYFSAAYYYYSNNLDMKKALEWINIAIEKDPKAEVFKKYKSRIEAKIN